MATTMAYNRDKLKRLIHYVAYRCVDRPSVLDGVKMNKALLYSDQAAFVASGTPITGATYIKKRLGPVVSELMPIVDELEAEKALAVRHLDGEHRQYLALTTPDMSDFSGEEMRMIEDAITLVCEKHTSRSISQKSHDVVWKLTELDDEIPYYAMLAGRLDEIDADDIAWAEQELAGA